MTERNNPVIEAYFREREKELRFIVINGQATPEIIADFAGCIEARLKAIEARHPNATSNHDTVKAYIKELQENYPIFREGRSSSFDGSPNTLLHLSSVVLDKGVYCNEGYQLCKFLGHSEAMRWDRYGSDPEVISDIFAFFADIEVQLFQYAQN